MTRLANGILLTLVLLTAFTFSIASESKSEVIRKGGYTGVVFPAEKRAFRLTFHEKSIHYWTPSEADVQTAEKEIPGFLQTAGTKDARAMDILKKLKTYKRQYAGIASKGEKWIYINFFCAKDYSEDHWTKHEVMVFDGGSCFF